MKGKTMKVTGKADISAPELAQGHFNRGEHLFVAIEPGRYQTISCGLPNGRHVTFAFVPGSSEGTEMECVDIHATVGKHFSSDHTVGKEMWTHHLVGFSADGGDAFDTRRLNHARRTSLATLLLSLHHYQNDSDRRAENPWKK